MTITVVNPTESG